MNILQTPPHYNILENSVSLAGCIKLKAGRYTNRYIGSKNLEVLPNGTISKTQRKKNEKKQNKPRAKLGLPIDNNMVPNNEYSNTRSDATQKLRYYKLKKSIIKLRIQNYINQQIGVKQLYFWTITFPNKLNDDLCYKYFNNWLSQLRTKNLLRSYLWVAERQQNNTIHYHIAIPHKMHVLTANSVMQTILSSGVRKKEFDWNLQAAKRYNGVDICKNRKTKRVTNFAIKKGQKSLSNYLTKYITKNNSEFTHYCWHCSRDFSNLIIKISFTQSELLSCNFELYLNDERIFESEYCFFIPWRSKPPPKVLEHFKNINRKILSNLV